VSWWGGWGDKTTFVQDFAELLKERYIWRAPPGPRYPLPPKDTRETVNQDRSSLRHRSSFSGTAKSSRKWVMGKLGRENAFFARDVADKSTLLGPSHRQSGELQPRAQTITSPPQGLGTNWGIAQHFPIWTFLHPGGKVQPMISLLFNWLQMCQQWV